MSAANPETKSADAPPTNQEVFDSLCEGLKEACQCIEKLKGEKNVDEIEELKYTFYSNLLEVQDAVKDMLKAFRKKYKMTEKEVRARMDEEDGDDEGEEESADGSAEPEATA